MHRTLTHLVSSCLLVLAAAFVPSGNACAGCGINLSSVSDYSSQLVFTDLFRQARPWLTRQADGKGPWDTVVPFTQRADGYPTQVPFHGPDNSPHIVHTLLAREIQGHYPAGEYVVQFRGNGTLFLGFDGGNVRLEGPGPHTVQINPSDAGIWVHIERSEKDAPVHDIRVTPSSAEGGMFNADFLESTARFGLLRFMDMGRTNNSQITSWKQRTIPGWYTQGGSEGMAWEYMADLANHLHADAWVCVPHLADNDYASQMARLLDKRLDPELAIYLEYSNELWNGAFEQHAYVRSRGLEQGLSRDPFEAALLYGLKRSLEIFTLFEKELRPGRKLVRVIGSQSANTWAGQVMVDALGKRKINPGKHTIDAVAIAPYFGHDVAEDVCKHGAEGTSPEKVVALCMEHLPQVETEIREYARMTARRGLRLLAYEGGQHLAATTPQCRNNEQLTELLTKANRIPAMGTAYTRLLNAWQKAGAGEFALFASIALPTRYGSWGLLEWTGQPTNQSPKYSTVASHPLCLREAPQ